MQIVRFNRWRNARVVRYDPMQGDQERRRQQADTRMVHVAQPQDESRRLDGRYAIRFVRPWVDDTEERRRREAEERAELERYWAMEAWNREQERKENERYFLMGQRMMAMDAFYEDTQERDRRILGAAAWQSQQPPTPVRRGFMPRRAPPPRRLEEYPIRHEGHPRRHEGHPRRHEGHPRRHDDYPRRHRPESEAGSAGSSQYSRDDSSLVSRAVSSVARFINR